jgi:hypothetical protein
MKHARDDEGVDEAAPAAKRSRREGWPDKDHLIRVLRARFTVNPNRVNATARDARVTFDGSYDPETKKPRHDYHIMTEADGAVEVPGPPFMSITAATEKFGKPFNATWAAAGIRKKAEAERKVAADAVAAASAAALAPLVPIVVPPAEPPAKATKPPTPLDPRYRNVQTDADVLGQWRATADRGSDMHDIIDRFVTADPTLSDEVVREKMPLGFLRFWYDHPELTVYRTEMTVFSERHRLVGKLDVLCEDGILIDYKTYQAHTFFDEAHRDMLAARGYGIPATVKGKPAPLPPPPRSRAPPKVYHMTHPLMADAIDNKLEKTCIQTNLYGGIINAECPEYTARFGPVSKLWIVNVPQGTPFEDEYNVLTMPAWAPDVAQPCFDLFPWDDFDARHLAATTRDFALDYIYPTPLRAAPPEPEPTVVAPPDRDKLAAHDPAVAWVGRKYVKGEDWNLPDSPWAGPPSYAAMQAEERIQRLRKFEADLLRDRERLARLVPDLFGRTLMCWCPRRLGTDEDVYCHARVLAKYANALGLGRVQLKTPPPPPVKSLFF